MKLQNSIPFSQEGYLSFYCTIKDSNALIVGTNPYVDSTMADENGNKIPPVTIDRYFKYGHWWFDVKANTIIFYFENGKPMAYSIKDIDFNHVFLLKRKYN